MPYTLYIKRVIPVPRIPCHPPAGIVVVFYDYFGAFKQPAEVVEFKSVSNLPFLFGVVIYSYEGVGMILPVEASMKRKEKFPLTLTFVMTLITAIYVSFGAVGAFY